MKEKDLQKLINALPVPEPRPEARRRAIQEARDEFDRQLAVGEKTTKGFARWWRLFGKTLTGGPAMVKPIAITTTVCLALAMLVMIITPNFLAYRTRSSYDYTTAVPDRAAPENEIAGKADADKVASMPVPSAPMEQRTEAFRSREVPQKKARLSMHQPVSDQEYIGRDRFEAFDPNPVKRAAEDPVSTFSIDVDTAAYAFVRRALNNGHLPPTHAVRIEELINYFDYEYPLPTDRETPFQPMTAVFPAPWNPNNLLLHIGIKGFNLIPAQRPKANLVFLIDVSGSMNMPGKLPLLKNAFRLLVETLEPEDMVSLVVYAGAAGTVLEPTPIREKGKILDALENLRAGGSTAGGAGIRKAYSLAESHFDPEGVNRVILATDGDFNVGIRDPEALKNFVERKRRSGIYLSVLGFGQGNYNDALMQKLAQNGNGNAAYIDSLNEARKVLVDEAVSTLFPIAKDVKIQVEFNPAIVAEYRLIGYETRQLRREDFNNDQVDAGEIGAGHSVTALYEITPVNSSHRLVDDLRYGKPVDSVSATKDTSGELAFLKIRYKLPDADTSRLIQKPIRTAEQISKIGSVPSEARFAAAVAAFGQLLRNDPYTKDFSWDDVLALANTARGSDPYGYRAEFLSLVRLAKTARAMGDR